MDDMIGKIFGDFKVIDKHNSETKYDYKYVCECVNCGSVAIKNKSTLKQWKNYCSNCKGLIGKTFGDFKVLSKVSNEDKYKYIYECECINCGNKENKSHNYLKHTKSKCSKCNTTYNVRDLTESYKELIGEVFGKLTVTDFYKVENSHRVWVCSCDCGKKCYKNTAYLKRESENAMCPKCKALLNYTNMQNKIAQNVLHFDENSIKNFLNTNEDFKPIQDFNGYYVGCFGTIVSCKNEIPKIISAWLDSGGRYYIVNLQENGKAHKKLVHRLVAEAFVDNSNPIMFNTVNHKDCNEKNNDYRNLEWCTDKYNTYYSYQTLPPDRNRIECILVFPDGNKKRFESYADIIRYKRENSLEFSETGLQKYCKSKGFKLIKLGKTSNVGRTGWTKEQINEMMTDGEVIN